MEVPSKGVKSASKPTEKQQVEKQAGTPAPIDPKKALFASNVITPKTKEHSTSISAKIGGIEDLFQLLRMEEMVIHATGQTGPTLS